MNVTIIDEPAPTRAAAEALVEALLPGKIIRAWEITVDDDYDHQLSMDGPPAYREAYDVVVWDDQRAADADARAADDDDQFAHALARYLVYRPRQ